jgi:quercetin dioxygenase-like cupin family protein
MEVQDMAMVGAKLTRMSMDEPDEVRPFEGDAGHLNIVNTDMGPIGRAVFEPGWRWSEHVKPIAKTDSCQAPHVGYVISGQMGVVMDDQTREDFREGDVMIVPPGHDAWTIGDEACVVVDWTGFGDYAKRS